MLASVSSVLKNASIISAHYNYVSTVHQYLNNLFKTQSTVLSRYITNKYITGRTVMVTVTQKPINQLYNINI